MRLADEMTKTIKRCSSSASGNVSLARAARYDVRRVATSRDALGKAQDVLKYALFDYS